MNKGLKIALVVIVILLVCCCIGGVGTYVFAQQAFVTDSAQAAKIGHEIASYEAPPGYGELFAMNMAGIKMVALGPQGQSSTAMALFLMEFPAALQLDEKEMERQMSAAFERQSQRGATQMQAVGNQKTMIRGQVVTLTLSEGNDAKGTRLRQALGTFASKNGTTMFMAMSPKASWNDTLIARFLASIR